MLKSLQIKNFRGFRDLKIEPLKRVNLIVGQNNTGKTGVLEALVLLLGEDHPKYQNQKTRQMLPQLFRSIGGDPNENFWKWLFTNKNLDQTIQIKASFNGSSDGAFEIQLVAPQKEKANLRVDKAGNKTQARPIGGMFSYEIGERNMADLSTAIFSTLPSDPIRDAVEYQRVIVKRKKRQVERLLREIEPRLEAVEALRIGDQNSPSLIYADIGLSEMIPVTQLGQGFNRLLDIYSEIVVEDARVLLIDEVENGLHYSVMPVIWKGLFLAAEEFDVQIFATTHSWECILAADQAARERPEYELAVIRLDRVKEDIKATIIDEKAMSTAKDLQWEMR